MYKSSKPELKCNVKQIFFIVFVKTIKLIRKSSTFNIKFRNYAVQLHFHRNKIATQS